MTVKCKDSSREKTKTTFSMAYIYLLIYLLLKKLDRIIMSVSNDL